MSNWKYWGYLLLAALLESAWTFCLKWMAFSELKQLRWSDFCRIPQGPKVLGPFAGYILFGLGNVYFFSLATKHIPLATAFAVWTGISLVLISIGEAIAYRQKPALAEIGFLLMIMGGVAGLRWLDAKA